MLSSPDSAVVDAPLAGVTYGIGDRVGDAVVVADSNSGIASGRGPSGWLHYAAFAYDDSLNYSVPSNPTHTYTMLAVQTATLEIDVTDPDNPTVTVVAAPATFPLSATAGTRPADAITSSLHDDQLQLEAIEGGSAGNGIAVTLSDSGDGTTPAVSVSESTITVTYDLNASTAGEVANAINGDTAASALVRARAPVDAPMATTASTTLADGADADLRVWLSATNDNPRIVHNLKAVVTSVDVGEAASRWLWNEQAFAYFGPTGMGPGDTSAGWFDIVGGASAGGVITVELELHTHAFVAASGQWGESFVMVDPSGSGAELAVTSEELSYKGENGDSRHRDGFITPDGRWMLLGNHNMPQVVAVDLVTLRPALAIDLDDGSGVGFIDAVTQSPDHAHAYAVVTYGTHAAFWQPTAADGASVEGASSSERVALVKISMADFSEVGRVELLADSTLGARGRRLSLSADGTVGAVSIAREGVVALVDLDTMTVRESFDTSATSRMNSYAAISPDGATTYVAFTAHKVHPADDVEEPNDGTLAVIDNATGTMVALSPPTLADETRVGFLEFGPSGKLWYGRKNVSAVGALSVYDPASATWSEVPDFTRASGLEISPDGERVYLFDSLARVIRTWDTASSSWIFSAESGTPRFGHKVLATPWVP